MRAILIDPMNTQEPVSEIAMGRHYSEINKALSDRDNDIDVSMFCVAFSREDGETWYVDDNGLHGARAFVMVEGGHQPFAGRALILKTDLEGESQPTDLSVSSVLSRIAVFSNHPMASFGIEKDGAWHVGEGADLLEVAPDRSVLTLLDNLQKQLDNKPELGAEPS